MISCKDELANVRFRREGKISRNRSRILTGARNLTGSDQSRCNMIIVDSSGPASRRHRRPWKYLSTVIPAHAGIQSSCTPHPSFPRTRESSHPVPLNRHSRARGNPVILPAHAGIQSSCTPQPSFPRTRESSHPVPLNRHSRARGNDRFSDCFA